MTPVRSGRDQAGPDWTCAAVVPRSEPWPTSARRAAATPISRPIDLGGSPRREAAGRRPPAGGGRGWRCVVAGFVAVWGLVAILAGVGGRPGRRRRRALRQPPKARRDTTTLPIHHVDHRGVPGALGPDRPTGWVWCCSAKAPPMGLLDLDTGTAASAPDRGLRRRRRSLLVEPTAGLEPVDRHCRTTAWLASLLTDGMPMMAWVADGAARSGPSMCPPGAGGRARLLRPGRRGLPRPVHLEPPAVGHVADRRDDGGLPSSAPPVARTSSAHVGGIGRGRPVRPWPLASPYRSTSPLATSASPRGRGGRRDGPTSRSRSRADGRHCPASSPRTARAGVQRPGGRGVPRAVLVDRPGGAGGDQVRPRAGRSPDGRWLAVLGPGSVTLVDTLVGTPGRRVEVDQITDWAVAGLLRRALPRTPRPMPGHSQPAAHLAEGREGEVVAQLGDLRRSTRPAGRGAGPEVVEGRRRRRGAVGRPRR